MEVTHFSTSLGSYNPFFFKLVVKRTWNSELNEQSKFNEFSESETATLFHEFVHHLQNIASIPGLSHFSSLISIWHNTRIVSYDQNDNESASNLNMAYDNIKNYLCKKTSNKTTKSIMSCQVNKINQPIDNLAPIKISVMIEEQSLDIDFGIADFFESSAYELENFYRKQIGLENIDDLTPTIPYKIGRGICKMYIPELDEVTFIKILLTSSQHASPHKAFICLLQEINEIGITGNLDKILELNLTKLIGINSEFIEKVKGSITSGFPMEDYIFGDVIKSIFEVIDGNIKKQFLSPFPELEFLLSVNKDNYKEKLEELIDSFGGCVIYRDSGIDTSIEDNKIYFVESKNSAFKHERGWKVLQAAIDYSLIHYTPSTKKVAKPHAKHMCPMHPFCDHTFNINKNEYCNVSPWLHPGPVDDGNDCPYQLAVYKTDLKNVS